MTNFAFILLYIYIYIYIYICMYIDENQQAPLKDLLHVPVRPITRVRSKKIKEALNGLI
jgi:hypothetical protein